MKPLTDFEREVLLRIGAGAISLHHVMTQMGYNTQATQVRSKFHNAIAKLIRRRMVLKRMDGAIVPCSVAAQLTDLMERRAMQLFTVKTHDSWAAASRRELERIEAKMAALGYPVVD